LFVSLFSSFFFFFWLIPFIQSLFYLATENTNLKQEKEKRGMSKMGASDRPESQLSSSSWAERKMDQ
jgi:hypothetical protein